MAFSIQGWRSGSRRERRGGGGEDPPHRGRSRRRSVASRPRHDALAPVNKSGRGPVEVPGREASSGRRAATGGPCLLLLGGLLAVAVTLLVDPRVDEVGDLGDQGEVVAGEARSVLPLASLVLVQPRERDVVKDAILAF